MRIFSRSNYSFVIWSVIWAKLNRARTWSNAAHGKYFRFAHNLVAKFYHFGYFHPFFSFIALLFHISFDIYFVPTCLFFSYCLIINEWIAMFVSFSLSFFFNVNLIQFSMIRIFLSSYFLSCLFHFTSFAHGRMCFFVFLLILPSSHFF